MCQSAEACFVCYFHNFCQRLQKILVTVQYSYSFTHTGTGFCHITAVQLKTINNRQNNKPPQNSAAALNNENLST